MEKILIGQIIENLCVDNVVYIENEIDNFEYVSGTPFNIVQSIKNAESFKCPIVYIRAVDEKNKYDYGRNPKSVVVGIDPNSFKKYFIEYDK